MTSTATTILLAYHLHGSSIAQASAVAGRLLRANPTMPLTYRQLCKLLSSRKIADDDKQVAIDILQQGFDEEMAHA